MLDANDKDRNVIPRWRPLIAIEKNDLGSLGRYQVEAPKHTSLDFRDQTELWRSEGTLEAATDIFDTYLLTGDVALLRLANSIFEKHSHLISPRLRHSLTKAHQKAPDTLDLRRLIASRETDREFLWESISKIKKRIAKFPRDALAYLEIARLYTICGQFNKAENQLGMARKLAPENRVILRATIKFYHIVSDLETGIKVLQSSERLKFDPWVKSAEIATATTLQTSSKAASKSLVRQLQNGTVARDSTELAMALATLEQANGVKERSVFKLVSKALPTSTENGFAQAIWLSNNSSRDFLHRFPESEPSSEAYEAKVKLAISKQEFVDAIGFSELWVEDQPFSKDAIIWYLNLSAVHQTPDQTAVRTAKRASRIFGHDWRVLNASHLVLAETSELDLAQDVLAKLKREAPQGAPRAFVEAAEGLLAFKMGDFLLGRDRYDAAATTARNHKANDLLINSALFWLRCEVTNNLITQECTSEVVALIDKVITKAKLTEREYISNTWTSIKDQVLNAEHPDSNISELNEGHFFEVISENLDDPELLENQQLF